MPQEVLDLIDCDDVFDIEDIVDLEEEIDRRSSGYPLAASASVEWDEIPF